MLSGRRLDLLDPSPLDIEIEDIAHGLARVARWNGQTFWRAYLLVAQHTLLVEAVARARVPRLGRTVRLAILLHDAPEYVIGDMISPFKAVIGDIYKGRRGTAVDRYSSALRLPAARSPDTAELIKAADHGAAYLEATNSRLCEPEARRFFGRRRSFRLLWSATISRHGRPRPQNGAIASGSPRWRVRDITWLGARLAGGRGNSI